MKSAAWSASCRCTLGASTIRGQLTAYIARCSFWLVRLHTFWMSKKAVELRVYTISYLATNLLIAGQLTSLSFWPSNWLMMTSITPDGIDWASSMRTARISYICRIKFLLMSDLKVSYSRHRSLADWWLEAHLTMSTKPSRKLVTISSPSGTSVASTTDRIVARFSNR